MQRFFNSAPGKVLLVLVILGGGVFAYYQIRNVFGESAGAAHANDRIFVCSETGKSFHVTLTASTQVPAYSPFSGKPTGYPAELCYWTADGKIKSEPTAVLMNVYVGKSGPTFCPDCGRLVVGHNPQPHEGSTPPPTKAEYEARRAY
jgi:hypothetical protein